MVSVPERLARLEAEQDALKETVDRNHEEAMHWRRNLDMKVGSIVKNLEELNALLNQAKGVRWLAGLILTAVGAFVIVVLKELLTYFTHR